MDENLIKVILNTDKKTKKIFSGVYARDERPLKPSYPSCFIVNTHPRSKSGEHWLAFFYDSNGFCDFFDSYGQPPSSYRLKTYINKTSKGWRYYSRRLQGHSDFCGIYAILFLLFKTIKKVDEFFREFYFNYSKNDEKIIKTFKLFLK